MSAHARLGPSNHRWVYCAGSVREEARYPDISSPSAVDGTGSHLLLELCLQNGVRAEDYEGTIIGENHPDNINGWLVDSERCKRVQMCLDYVASRVAELKKNYAKVIVTAETKSDVGGMFGRDDWWGTVDITIKAYDVQTRLKFVEICDYKDGQGYVHAEDNSQLLSYAGGMLRKHVASGPDLVRPFNCNGVDGVRMTIVQPKTNPIVRHQDTTAHYVIEKCEWLAKRAHATDDPEAPLTPDGKGGKGYCRWCKHKSNCVAQSQKSLEVIKSMSNISVDAGIFEMVTQSADKIKEMTNEQLTKLADVEAGVQAVFDKVKAEIEDRINQGQTVNGFAMVNGKASKIWALPEEEMVKKLRSRKLTLDDIYPKKLASPAQILKNDKLTESQKKKLEKELIVVKAGAKRLGRVAYERQEKDVKLMFADVAPNNQEKTSDNGLQCNTNDVKSDVSFF